MFSHSSARAIVDHPRDVPDDVLRRLQKNGGVVMVNFYPGYVSAARNRWDADYAAERARYDSPPFGGIYIGQPERAKAALDEWVKAHPAPDGHPRRGRRPRRARAQGRRHRPRRHRLGLRRHPAHPDRA